MMQSENWNVTNNQHPIDNRDRAAAFVRETWHVFQNALVSQTTYPIQQFRSFAQAARTYSALTKADLFIDLGVARTITGLAAFLQAERKRVPSKVLEEAQGLECLFLQGHDPTIRNSQTPPA